jgi:hypothetical protein
VTELTRTLADDIETILHDVIGVTAVYPTAALPAVVVGEVLATTGLPETVPPRVSVQTDDEGTTVTALIGVTDGAPAHETGRAVHARIVDYLNGTRARAHDVTVRIGTVG